MPNLTVTHRFILAVGLPTLMLVVLAGLHIERSWLAVRSAEAVSEGVALVADAQSLVHELQKERGTSAGFIGSRGDAGFAERLDDQRRETDAALEVYRAHVADYARIGTPQVTEGSVAAVEALQALDGVRAKVSEGGMTVGDMAGWYTGVIRGLLGSTPDLRRESSFAEGDAMLAAWDAMANAKEQAGLERAMGANGFGSGAFAPSIHERFLAHRIREAQFLDIARHAMKAEQAAELDRLENGPEMAEVKRMRGIAAAGLRLGRVQGVTGGQWFDASTALINRMKEIEDAIAARLSAMAETARAAQIRSLVVMASLVALATLFALGVAWTSARGIVQPLRIIGRSLDQAGIGKDIDLPEPVIRRRDEIGLLARNAVEMQRTTDKMNRVTSALDVSAGPIVVCNSRYYITYANPAFSRMIQPLRAHFAGRGVEIDKLVGRQIDDFHEGKARVRAMLESLNGEHVSTVGIADRLFDVHASPIIDDQRRHLGFVIVWDDVTDTRRLEEQLREVIAAAGAGDFEKRIEVDTSDEFLRELGEGMNGICSIVAAFAADVDRSVRALAEGDLTRRVEGDYKGVLGKLAAGVNETVDRLDSLVSDIKSAGGRVRSASDEIADGAGALAERAESQAAALEETAALMEEMTGSVKANADSSGEARSEAEEADLRADSGRVVVEEAVSAMSLLSDSSRRMTEIVDVIASIATQTNLLALNAAVEAARAGDAGKGFAVVASEVGALARRSREAADDIRGLIQESSERVDAGVGLVERTGSALGEMAEALRRISESVGRINAASREQANGVEEINQAVSQMDENTQRNAALADTSARAARQLATESEELGRLTSMFRTRDGAGSGSSVRAA